MDIGVDIRLLTRGSHTGVEEYTVNLLNHLLPLSPHINWKLFYNAYQKVNFNFDWTKLPNVRLYSFNYPNRFLNLMNRFSGRPKIDELLGGVDVFFSPHFIWASLSKKCYHVTTFHDLSFCHYPDFFSYRHRFWHFSMSPKKQAERSDKIIAVSNSTKQDLIDFYNISPEKIYVIYSGINNQFRKVNFRDERLRTVKKKYGLPSKFILYFGTIEPRKNILGLIRAFYCLKNLGFKDLKLVIAGAKGWLYEEIFKEVKKSKYFSEIFFTGFVDEEDKVYLYNLADLFVYPSFFEGFGFPPLEAMACGVPTVTSCVSSLPEVIGDNALMVDPWNIDELVDAMKILLTDQKMRLRFKRRSIRLVQKFSWFKTAQETLKVLTDF